MRGSSIKVAVATRTRMAAGILALAASVLAFPTSAETLVPQTKLRVGVIQWMPTKGMYERWDALGGDFVVSQDGTVVMPVIGPVSIGDLDTVGLAAEIAKRLQEKLALVDRPDTTVEILDYPPVYVVGDVTKPGEYRYREGMTVLQALALSGGRSRVRVRAFEDEARLVSELQSIETGILRSTARIARLEAEKQGAHGISFPAAAADDQSAQQIFAQERVIFTTRANELERQTGSLADLRELLSTEIDVLQEKIKAADASIRSAETELANVTGLVEKGIAVASRKSDLERALSSDRMDRLDQITAVMRARQAISEATRNEDGLRDRKQTEVAAELQAEQASLAELKRRRELSQKLLLDRLGSQQGAGAQEAQPTFTIIRRQNGLPVEIAASSATDVAPGDVVSVAGRQTPEASGPAATAEFSATDTSSEELGQ
ncbi:polysaccharide biosynthesis/export family protein [Mesorhizobium sp. L-8-3]